MGEDPLATWLEGQQSSPDPGGFEPAWWAQDRDDGGQRSWEEDDRSRLRRRWGLVALAIVPWIAVAVVALANSGSSRSQQEVMVPVASAPPGPAALPPDPPQSTTARSTAQPASQDVPGREPTASPSRLTSSALAGLAAPAGLELALAAPAALTVQHALTSIDEATGAQRYVDLALPERVTWVGDVAIVQVAALVLEGEGGHWEETRPARYAVPLQVNGDVVRVLGAPWAIPAPPQITPGESSFVAFNDPALAEAVGRGLDETGYAGVKVRSLGRDPQLPGVLRAEVTAIGPGERQSRAHTVWLRDHPTPTVLGTAVSDEALDAPSAEDAR